MQAVLTQIKPVFRTNQNCFMSNAGCFFFVKYKLFSTNSGCSRTSSGGLGQKQAVLEQIMSAFSKNSGNFKQQQAVWGKIKIGFRTNPGSVRTNSGHLSTN